MTPEEQAKMDELEKRVLVATALSHSSIPFHDRADAENALTAQATKKDDGAWSLPDKAVETLATNKPHWVKPPAGHGARGSSAPAPSQKTYADLLKLENQPELAKLLKDNPAELERLKQIHYASN